MKLVSIFHPGRCGSTVLERVIAKCGLYHFGEVFRPTDNIYTKFLPDNSWNCFSSINDFLLYLQAYAGIVTSLDTSKSVFASSKHAFIETKLNNYKIDPFATIAQIARSESVAGCVFLYGKNYLRKYMSIVRAKETGVWHARKDQMNYQPKLLDIDFNNIHDPDILMLHHMPFLQAQSWYHRILTTQFEVIKQSCSASSKPFISICFEDIISTGGVVATVEKLFKRFNIDISSDSIQDSYVSVPLKRTGVDDLVSGLTVKSQAQFKEIPLYESYLPGGINDLSLE